jgi:hypothetical protein
MTAHKGHTIIDTVLEVLATHVAEDGWCRGCREQWGRMVPHPCTQAEWAAHVHEAEPEAGR